MSELESRKWWKEDLRCVTWQRIMIEINPCVDIFLKFIFTDSRYEIMISNLTTVWFESMEIRNIERRNKEINPTVEVPIVKLLKHLEETLMGKNDGTKFQLTPSIENDDVVVLSISFDVAGLPFVWNVEATKTNNEMVHVHLTEPLMLMVCQMNRERNELIQLLKNKDKEIFDFKSQGIQTSRKNLETKPFDERSLRKRIISSKEFEEDVKCNGRNAFEGEENLYREVTMKRKRKLLEGENSNTSIPSSAAAAALRSEMVDNADLIASSTSNNQNFLIPNKSPDKQPNSEEFELLRRQELEAKLSAKESKTKKKKIKF